MGICRDNTGKALSPNPSPASGQRGTGIEALSPFRVLCALVIPVVLLCAGDLWAQADGSGLGTGAGVEVAVEAGDEVGGVSGTDDGTGAGTGMGSPPLDVAAWLEQATIEVSVEGEGFRVGDPIPVILDVGLPEGGEVLSVASMEVGRLEFLDRFSVVGDREDGGTAVGVTVTFVAYRPGLHRISGFGVQVRLPDGSESVLRAPGVELRVVSLLANEQAPEPRGEKAGVPVEYRDYLLAWVLGIGGGLLLMVMMVFLIAKSRPPVIEKPPPVVQRQPHEIALEKLDSIRSEDLIGSDELMELFVRLSETVREYLGNRYVFNGLDLTTGEIWTEMLGVRMPSSFPLERLNDLLLEFDMVKFAKVTASREVQLEALETSYSLVRATMVAGLPQPVLGAE